MNFEFATATRIIFGAGTVKHAGPIAKELGRRALVVTGKNTARAEAVLRQLDRPVVFSVAGEPTFDDVRSGRERARQEQCDVVIGYGGGSAMDAGKAIAALLTNGGDPLDYVEVIGAGKPITKPSVPFLAIPTTAGTGSEVTRNAVLGSPEHRVKASIRSPWLLPRVALVDPEIVYAPVDCRLDALTQLIESFVSVRANPMTDAICREGLQRWREGGVENWALAALFSGLALANAGLGAVHAFAMPIGGKFHAPHGAVCGALLPHVMEANERIVRRRGEERKFEEVRQLVGDVKELCRELPVPGLQAYGVQKRDFPAIIEAAAQATSMKGNPAVLSPDDLRQILEQAL